MSAEPRCRPSASGFCLDRHNIPPRIAGAFVRFVAIYGTDDTVTFDTVGRSLREVHMFLRSCRIRYDANKPGFELVSGNVAITVHVSDSAWLDRTKVQLRRCRSFHEAVYLFLGRVQAADAGIFRINVAAGMPIHSLVLDECALWP